MSLHVFLPMLRLFQRETRVVIEVECSLCGPVFQIDRNGLDGIEAATAHTSATGHVVILNGTVDLPEQDEAGEDPV